MTKPVYHDEWPWWQSPPINWLTGCLLIFLTVFIFPHRYHIAGMFMGVTLVMSLLFFILPYILRSKLSPALSFTCAACFTIATLIGILPSVANYVNLVSDYVNSVSEDPRGIGFNHDDYLVNRGWLLMTYFALLCISVLLLPIIIIEALIRRRPLKSKTKTA